MERFESSLMKTGVETQRVMINTEAFGERERGRRGRSEYSEMNVHMWRLRRKEEKKC